jgi:hypothetical protein
MKKKIVLNRMTAIVCRAIVTRNLEPDVARLVSEQEAVSQLARNTYVRDPRTGAVKLGLCARGIRQWLKRNPQGTFEQLREYFKIA